MSLRELALFAGAGGGLLGSEILGWRTVCAVEIDGYARRVLLGRQNDGSLGPFPIWDDIRTFDGWRWRGAVDVVSGGFPCQPFSTASRGRATATDLWPEMLRVVDEVAPTFVFAENVQSQPIRQAASDLTELDYVVRCARVPASALGAPHRRERFWLVASNADDERQRTVAFDAQVAGLRRVARVGWGSALDPGVLGDDARLPDRMDRMRCLGNAQVPFVTAFAWRFLRQKA